MASFYGCPKQLAIQMFEELKKDLLAIGIPDVEWFLFGSFLRGKRAPSDIDLLALCKDHRVAISVRENLSGLVIKFPIHLLVVTKDEERDLNFIEEQACQRLFDNTMKPNEPIKGFLIEPVSQ